MTEVLGKSRLSSRFAGTSTAVKMLLILSAWLFPLGLIAILASVQSARDNAQQRSDETHARLEIKAQRIDSALSRAAVTIRAASAAIRLTPPGSNVCERTLERLARSQTGSVRYALYSDGSVFRCGSAAYVPPIIDPSTAAGDGVAMAITPEGDALRFALFDDDGSLEGVGEFPISYLADLTAIPGTSLDFDLTLEQPGGPSILLRDGFQGGALIQTVSAETDVANGRLRLRIMLGAPPISALEVLMITLPVMMWLAAALIGWIIVDRLLLRALIRMQQAVAAYRPGDHHLALPMVSSPAREIGELGLAFDNLARTVARHEADLEAALERQKLLVREVHHRVKNNLQVVASLLNLHARGATSEDVAAAYASIQRRVDALAVVHRNHYAELEDNRGVGLKPLVAELGANLRATAPPNAANMQIRVDLEPVYSTQDVAVSVAFLVTEIIEFAMFCGSRAVAISLERTGPNVARLAVESGSLSEQVQCEERLTERFERVITGLSRQLRSTIERDGMIGRYALDISIIDSPGDIRAK